MKGTLVLEHGNHPFLTWPQVQINTHEFRLPQDLLYSGLQKHCNVWQFWIACDVALYSMGITLSIVEMK